MRLMTARDLLLFIFLAFFIPDIQKSFGNRVASYIIFAPSQIHETIKVTMYMYLCKKKC